ncbi:MAG TPA: LppX_LprAFG lipoprotein [Gaiellaceae bacterium]
MRRLAVAVMLLALPLAAAACGGSKPKATGAASGAFAMAAVQAAARKTALAGSEHMTLNVAGATSGQSLAVKGQGDFDNTKHVGSLHMNFSVSTINSTIDVVLNQTNMYLKSPLFALVLPTGKTWLKLDLAKAAASQGLNLNTLLSQDPTKTLSSLQSLRGATVVGTEQVDGVSTTQYRATIDPSKLPAAAGATQPGVYNVWVGDDGYVHRLRARVVTGSGTKKAVVNLTADLSSFGKPVTVTLPPPGQMATTNGSSIPGLGG